MDHVPLSVRRGVAEPFEMVEGVPAHIKAELLAWTNPFVWTDHGVSVENLNYLIRTLRLPIVAEDSHHRYTAFMNMLRKQDDVFLDVLDLLASVNETKSKELEVLLEDGGSVWAVSSTLPRQLEHRVSQTARDAVQRSAGESSGEHIANAWNRAYGRDPDATVAWNSAVKAIEVLLHPIVEPKNTKATLGTMVAALRNKPDKWQFEIALKDGDKTARPFIQALDLVTYEPGRHGTDPSRATVEQARVIVMQAVAITEWLRSGALTLAE